MVLQRGDVVDFVYLHLHSASNERPHPHKKHHYMFDVEGKERPGLVYDTHEANGISWYRLFPVTTKGLDSSGKIKERHSEIGKTIDPERISYIRHDIVSYPENLFKRRRQALHPLVFASVLKDIGFEGLQSGKDQK